MEHFLLQKGCQENPMKITLSEEEVIVGRRSFSSFHCSLQISRKHASFQVASNGDWFVKDLGSTNGVFVNGQRIGKGLHQVSIGDTIGFGIPHANNEDEFEFEFCSKSSQGQDFIEEILVDDTTHCLRPPNTQSNICVTESAKGDVANIGAEQKLQSPTKDCHNACEVTSGVNTSSEKNYCRGEIECIDIESDNDELCSANLTVKTDIENSISRNCKETFSSNCKETFSSILNVKQPHVLLKRCVVPVLHNPRAGRPDSCLSSSDTNNNPLKLQKRKARQIDSSKSSLSSHSLGLSSPKKGNQSSSDVKIALSKKLHQEKDSSCSGASTNESCTKRTSTGPAACEERNPSSLVSTYHASSVFHSNFQSSALQSSNISANKTQYSGEHSTLSSEGRMCQSFDKNISLEESKSVKSIVFPLCIKQEQIDVSCVNISSCVSTDAHGDSDGKCADKFVQSPDQNSNISRCKYEVVNAIPVKTETECEGHVKASFHEKPEENASLVKSECVSDGENSGSEGEGFFGYSQQDEVIHISDDDDYLNFPPSQDKYDEEIDTHIKKEPFDFEEENEEIVCVKHAWEQNVQAKIENEESDVLSSTKYNSSVEAVRAESLYNSALRIVARTESVSDENIDDVKTFIGNVPFSNDKSEDCAADKISDEYPGKEITQSERNVLQNDDAHDGDYFPILSQNFYDSDVSCKNYEFQPSKFYPANDDRSEGIQSVEQNVGENSALSLTSQHADQTEGNLTLIHKPKTNKTLLTEPKPMQHRPRYQRGREEWFEDRYEGKKSSSTAVTDISSRASVKKRVHVDTKERRELNRTKNCQKKSKTCKSSKQSKPSIRQKVKEQMGHRIRAPNGGSAIPMNQNKCSGKSDDHPSAQRIFKPSVHQKPLSRQQMSSTLSNLPVHRKSSKRQPERFSSRMTFLAEPPLPVQKSSGKISSKSKSENKANTFKIPKLGSFSNEKTNKKQPASSAVAVSNNHTTMLDGITREMVSNKTSSTSETRIFSSYSQGPDYTNSYSFNSVPKQSLSPAQDSASPLLAPSSSTFSLDNANLYSSHSMPNNCNTPSQMLKSYDNLNIESKQMNPHPQFLSRNFSHNEKPVTLLPAPPGRISSVQSTSVRDPRLRGKLSLNGNNDCSVTSHQMKAGSLQKYVSESEDALPISGEQNVNLFDIRKPITKRCGFEYLLAEALKGWSPSWLKEYVKIKRPPKCIRSDLVSLPLSFNSLSDYVNSFYSMIRLELWECIFEEWSLSKEKNSICIMVNQLVSKGDLMVLDCVSLLSSKSSFCPREGTLLIVDLRVKDCKEIVRVFGYVFTHKVNYYDPKSTRLHNEWSRRPELHSKDSVLFTFSMKTKKKTLSLNLEKLMKCTGLCYIANKLKLADTLQFLIDSPIQRDILCPSEQTFQIYHQKKSLSPSIIGIYNENQRFAIAGITEEMKKPYLHPKIILLQGPPGTGKTHTILGIIQSLLQNRKDKIKILVAAASNAAVDEIGRRLIQLKKQQKESGLYHSMNDTLRIVRVGLFRQIHQDVCQYSLEELTKQNSKLDLQKELNSLQSSSVEKQKCREKLSQQISLMSTQNAPLDDIRLKHNELQVETRRYQHLQDQIFNLTKKMNTGCLSDYACKLRVLKNADIILSTLSSCRQRILETVFGQRGDTHFTCCIVDEATQCTEPEVLQPLAFGLCKFILVGDHQQLPATVQSKLAAKYNFERSLFERVHVYFEQNNCTSPVFMLTQQYRMHSAICSFPSSYFYCEKLITFPGLDETYKSFPLKPFTVLDILYGQEHDSHSSKTNFAEAQTLVKICKHILHIFLQERTNKTIGIITPYQAQRHLYLKEFSQHADCKKIEINTVDGFQGREKDVIILSCVRARSASGTIGFLACKKRLNVAITRARQCLIICGHMSSLKNNPYWTALIDNAKMRKLYISVTSVKDIPLILNEMKNHSAL